MKLLSVILLVTLSQDGFSKKLTSKENGIIKNAENTSSEGLKLLEKIVNINSGTQNPAGVKKVGLLLKKEFEKIGMKTRWVDMPKEFNRGGHLFASTEGNKGPKVLIIGHVDTVFEKDSEFQKFYRKGDIAYGPGVNDMKGGVVVILSALKALKLSGVLNEINITVALMGDEEMLPKNDPEGLARKDLLAIAKKSDVAVGFEYAVDTINKATIARRSYTGWKIEVTAKQGHSSKIFSKEFGNGANFALSRILSQIHAKIKGRKYLTINPGLIAGGTEIDFSETRVKGAGKPNVIAKTATAIGDIRAISPEQLEYAKAELRKLVNKPLAGAKAKITFGEGYPPMPPTKYNKKLLKLLSKTSEDLGYGKVTALDPGKRGAADTSFVAPHVKSVIDGLGLLGDGAHSAQEKIDLSQFPKIIKRTSLFLYRLKDWEP